MCLRSNAVAVKMGWFSVKIFIRKRETTVLQKYFDDLLPLLYWFLFLTVDNSSTIELDIFSMT